MKSSGDFIFSSSSEASAKSSNSIILDIFCSSGLATAIIKKVTADKKVISAFSKNGSAVELVFLSFVFATRLFINL